MPSESESPASPTTEHRLHPFSWMFVLITQLKPVALPLLAVVLLGRGAWWEVLGAVGAGLAALYAFVTALAFRYRLAPDELIVREGVLGRTERHVPYARIQNIVQRRNPLHRIFDVTELRLESAGGTRPEAVMNVIRTAEAARIEAVLRGHRPAGADDTDDLEEDVLLTLPAGEVVRLGLVTNRGLVVIGAALAILSQVQPWEERGWRTIARGVAEAFNTWTPVMPGPAAIAALAVGGVLAVAVTQKLLSTVMALLSFHGFRLRRQQERIATERGLLVRQQASARRDKIQRVIVGEPFLARLMRRRWLWCEVAAGLQADGGEGERLRWLAPLASPADVERVMAHVTPGLGLEARQWQPLHPRAWRRRLLPSALFWTLGSLLGLQWLGLWAVPVWLVGLAWWYYEARRWAASAAWACDGGILGFRAGWLHRQWTVARLAKGQVVGLHRSPFDRRHGMASVSFDTAGAARAGLRFAIPYLPEPEARILFGRVCTGMLRSAMDNEQCTMHN